MACRVTPCFDEWKRFLATLRKIASGVNGRPLPGHEAQELARAVLIECDCAWPGRLMGGEPIAAPTLLSGTKKAHSPRD
jgi:hypothetical protein